MRGRDGIKLFERYLLVYLVKSERMYSGVFPLNTLNIITTWLYFSCLVSWNIFSLSSVGIDWSERKSFAVSLWFHCLWLCSTVTLSVAVSLWLHYVWLYLYGVNVCGCVSMVALFVAVPLSLLCLWLCLCRCFVCGSIVCVYVSVAVLSASLWLCHYYCIVCGLFSLAMTYCCVFCGCNVCGYVTLATMCMAVFSVVAFSVAMLPWLRRIWLCFL